MDRTQYLNLCRDCAILGERFGTKRNVPDKLRVIWKGGEYYPQSYELGFNSDGSVKHFAIIHDLTANSICKAQLKDIQSKEVENG